MSVQMGRQGALGLVCGTACLAVSFAVWPQGRAPQQWPMATRERVRGASWWPTQSTPPREEYLGPAACAGCHPSEASVQPTTSMAKAGATAANLQAFKAHERLSFQFGPYAYDLTRADGRSVFSVREGAHTLSTDLGYAFGEGEVGETYVYERRGSYYEGRLSYFSAIKALDITPGHSRAPSSGLEEALGRRMDADETHLCFGCHTTASSAGGNFEPQHLIPGVTCEACHGPGAKHVAAMKAGRLAEGRAHALNPAKLDPVPSVDFCGACHRAWADVMESGMEGIATVRFQPYRLELSRCWGKGDARLTCIACHDPHLPLVRDAASYDSRCLRCHAAKGSPAGGGPPGAACPRGTKDCATCHMPKYEVPGTHTRFTDHRIRVVQANTPYSD